MKFMKKSSMTFVVAMTLCMLFAFSVKLNVSASTVAYISSDGKDVSISFPSKSNTMYEVQLFNSAKKLVATKTCSFYASFSNKTTKNKLYYYRARVLTYNSSTYSYTPAKWSALKPFTTIKKFTVKIASKKSKAVNLKLPKIAGVTSYVVYISTKSTGGFKKVKAAKPGNVVKLSKYNGKAFKYYKNYYYKVVPKVKNKNTPAIIAGFYIYRTYY